MKYLGLSLTIFSRTIWGQKTKQNKTSTELNQRITKYGSNDLNSSPRSRED